MRIHEIESVRSNKPQKPLTPAQLRITSLKAGVKQSQQRLQAERQSQQRERERHQQQQLQRSRTAPIN